MLDDSLSFRNTMPPYPGKKSVSWGICHDCDSSGVAGDSCRCGGGKKLHHVEPGDIRKMMEEVSSDAR